MHSHRRNGQSLRGIRSSHRRIVSSHRRKRHSLLLRDSSLCRKVTCYLNDGHIFCGEYSVFHCEGTFFCSNMSINRRKVHVHRHDERVHSVIVHSPRGIGRTQCRKESSRGQSWSYYRRIGSVIHRKLRIDCRLESTLCGKRKAKSRVVRALRRSSGSSLARIWPSSAAKRSIRGSSFSGGAEPSAARGVQRMGIAAHSPAGPARLFRASGRGRTPPLVDAAGSR
jgi:hypothetical protein